MFISSPSQLIRYFDGSSPPIKYGDFLKQTKVKTGRGELVSLQEYIKNKNITTENLQNIYSHIKGRNDYLERFYKTSLEINPNDIVGNIHIYPTMTANHLNNDSHPNMKKIIRNMFWKEILRNSTSGLSNIPTFMRVLDDLYKHNIIDYKLLTPSASYYIAEGRIGSVFSSFYFRASIMNPYLVYSLAESVLFRGMNTSAISASGGNGFSVFTPTMGWGSYYYGFAETGRVNKYTGIDVIPSVCNKMAKFSQKYYPSINTVIYCKPSEDLAVSSTFMSQHRGKYDVVFFSPPYFQMELYEDNGKTQSTTRYKTYEEWLEKYWDVTIRMCSQVLKPGGKCCYIISGYGTVSSTSQPKEEQYKLIHDMNEITKKYLTHKKTYNMNNKNSNMTKHTETDEKIVLFEK